MIRILLPKAASLIGTLVGIILLLWLALPAAEPGVEARLLERALVTLPLAILAAALAFVLGAGGACAAVFAPPLRRILAPLAVILSGAPAFWVGLCLVFVAATALRLLPAGGFMPWQQSPGGALVSLTLPILALALPLAARDGLSLFRQIEGPATEPTFMGGRLLGMTIRQATWARRALPVLLSHGISSIGRFGVILSGAMIVENVFYLPGLGRLLFDAALSGDGADVRSVLIIVAVAAGVAMLIAATLEVLATGPRPSKAKL